MERAESFGEEQAVQRKRLFPGDAIDVIPTGTVFCVNSFGRKQTMVSELLGRAMVQLPPPPESPLISQHIGFLGAVCSLHVTYCSASLHCCAEQHNFQAPLALPSSDTHTSLRVAPGNVRRRALRRSIALRRH